VGPACLGKREALPPEQVRLGWMILPAPKEPTVGSGWKPLGPQQREGLGLPGPRGMRCGGQCQGARFETRRRRLPE